MPWDFNWKRWDNILEILIKFFLAFPVPTVFPPKLILHSLPTCRLKQVGTCHMDRRH